VFEHLQIYDTRERWMVGLADAGLTVATAALRPFGRRLPAASPPRRILLLRLERIGDLLMSWPAIVAARRLAPGARLDLIVGSWNESIAQLLEQVDRVETLDAKWLSRGVPTSTFTALLRRRRAWRNQGYDLAINFEGDIRSHLFLACSGARRRVGFDMAGGGPLLTDRVPYDPSCHVADNLLRLVERAFDLRSGSLVRTEERLKVPGKARGQADRLLAEAGFASCLTSDGTTALIGIQVGGGRQVKQWDPVRFGDLAARLAAKYAARLVFTGSAEDRPLVDMALARVPSDAGVIDLCGRADLPTIAGLLERFSVFITGDTGPMHLAAAVGTPLVAIFGPSDPRRWGPLSTKACIVHSAVDCRPCNRIRHPPPRCVGTIPDCLAAIGVDQVLDAVDQLLARTRGGVETTDDSR
jgi:ADP-heptose:LPS heptosyltransferase